MATGSYKPIAVRLPAKSSKSHLPKMEPIEFSVDSALLRELGERLVGKPHIALAELVKNSYDADATKVLISFSKNRIEISDNGHGMTFEEFRKFWMRIGSPHKQEQRVSRTFKRPVTGSKGVGRLAVQFLADTVEMHTVSADDTESEIEARINWRDAIRAGELTKAKAFWRGMPKATKFPDDSPHGTNIILSGLHQKWTNKDLRNLALEIWPLQPPFKSNPFLKSDKPSSFSVELNANKVAVRKFQQQMEAALVQWEAKISGKLERLPQVKKGQPALSKVTYVVEFDNGEKEVYEETLTDCGVYEVEFEIRIYRLIARQKRGITVQEARDYFKKYGGVHVYDAGFHLPYYGPDTDWLDVERDHAARLSTSQLLPEDLQITRGLQFLPTQRRIFGVVHVNTAQERDRAKNRGGEKVGDFLKIQVTRDRLVDNKAFQDLKDFVRKALDFYSVKVQLRNEPHVNEAVKGRSSKARFKNVEEALNLYEPQIPKPVFRDLKDQLKKALQASETETEIKFRQTSMLSSLATAGMSALAYQHEVSKQLNLLTGVTEDISSIRVNDRSIQYRLAHIAERLTEWLERARATRSLFSHLVDEENRTIRERFKAKNTIEQIIEQLGILLREVRIDTEDIDPSLYLPHGSFAEWSSVFQNILLNATNAMLDSKKKLISVSSLTQGHTRTIWIQDTGSGVNLESSGELFEPFVRKLKLSADRRALGLGGTGLGLTIVRMIATTLNCQVTFVEPDDGFTTAFQLSWVEKE
jgi:signal transduction histidine kinase